MTEQGNLEQQEQQAAVDKNLYFNMQKTRTDEDGVEHYGVWEEGWRDPDTHVIHFDSEPPAAQEGNNPAQHTDAAEKRAGELGVNIADVSGTGQDGRVTVNDVEAHNANVVAQQ